MNIKHINLFSILLIVFLFQVFNLGETIMEEQAVIVQFKYESTDLSKLYELEDELEERLDSALVGEFDGHDIAGDGSLVILYLYGEDAKMIYETIKDILMNNPLMNGAEVTLRYGPPKEEVKKDVLKSYKKMAILINCQFNNKPRLTGVVNDSNYASADSVTSSSTSCLGLIIL